MNKKFNVHGSTSGRLYRTSPRKWKIIDRKSVKAPNSVQVWHFIWERAMDNIKPDKKSFVNPDGSFRKLWKVWSQSLWSNASPSYKTLPVNGTMGWPRGHQAALGRALNYSENFVPNRRNANGQIIKAGNHAGVYYGWLRGSKPRGKRADKLLAIAGFEDFSHAVFVWAGAGGRPSPIWRLKPIKPLYTKDLVKLAVANIENHLGDCCDEDAPINVIYNEAFNLALDALADAGCSMDRASRIATSVANELKEQL